MRYDELETELSNRLNAHFTTNNLTELFYAVEMPDIEEDYRNHDKNPKAKVFVEYFDGLPVPSTSTNHVNQEETVIVRVNVEARKLRGSGGVFHLVAEVKKCLIGYKPINAMNRLTYRSFRKLDAEQNSIRPYVEFECKAVNVQAFDDFSNDPPIGATMNRIDLI